MKQITCPHCGKGITEKELIEAALIRAGENVNEAAASLGMSAATLYRRISEYEMGRDRRRMALDVRSDGLIGKK